MSPGFFLVVRFWVAPEQEAALLRWLAGGHVAEVVGQPGFLWCRRVKLTIDERGWQGYSMIYGIESQAAFDAYAAKTELHAKFARQRAPFAQGLHIERFAGEVDFSVEK